MTMPSDSESNVSGFINYSNKNLQQTYNSVIENIEIINNDLMEVQRDLKFLLSRVGPLEGQLNALLQMLPNPNLVEFVEKPDLNETAQENETLGNETMETESND